jgi:IS1 family transposase
MKRPEIYSLLSSNAAAIAWVQDNGMLTTKVKCPCCDSEMNLVKHHCLDNQIWECKKRVDGVRHCKKTSIRDGSIFARAHISIREAILLIFEWTRETSVDDCSNDFDLSKKCVSSWFSTISSLVSKEVKDLSRSTLLGNSKDVVEIDEAQIRRRKAHKGRKRNEVWVFGAVVRGSIHRQSFMKIVKNRKKATLQRVIVGSINNKVKMIVSDGLPAYEDINSLGFNHKTVNHSENYVLPEDKQVHTQTIEGYWKHLRAFLSRKKAYRRNNLSRFLREFIFRRNAPDCFECVLSAIQRRFSV